MRMHIGHVALQVTDLERSVDHAQRTLGLRESVRSGAQVLLSANEKHHELQLIASDRAGLDHIGLEVERDQDLDEVRDRLIRAGATILDERPREPGIDHALYCVGPSGMVFEIYAGMQRRPLSLDTQLRPLARRLGHVTLFSDEKADLEWFLLDVLGFRVSDRWGDFATWMRCDVDHHGIAVARRASGSQLHHYAFEVESLGALGHYADHIARQGQQFLWGPGRHGPGFNIFTYLPDPEGAIVEVYSDLLRIHDDAAYRAVDWSSEARAMNLWGPLMPADWDELGVPILTASTSTSARS